MYEHVHNSRPSALPLSQLDVCMLMQWIGPKVLGLASLLSTRSQDGNLSTKMKQVLLNLEAKVSH